MLTNRVKIDAKLVHYEGKLAKLKAAPLVSQKAQERLVRNKEKLT